MVWDVTWKGRQQKALMCLLNSRKESFYKGWFWACKQHDTESKDRFFFHELPSPRHSQWCPAEREYLQWCNLTGMAVLVSTLPQMPSNVCILHSTNLLPEWTFESMWHVASLTQELVSMSPLKFKHPENSELPLPVSANWYVNSQLHDFESHSWDLKKQEKLNEKQAVLLDSKRTKWGLFLSTFSFFQPLPYLGTHFQAILYHDQDQLYDPLVNDKVLMKFQRTTHPKYWKIY